MNGGLHDCEAWGSKWNDSRQAEEFILMGTLYSTRFRVDGERGGSPFRCRLYHEGCVGKTRD